MTLAYLSALACGLCGRLTSFRFEPGRLIGPTMPDETLANAMIAAALIQSSQFPSLQSDATGQPDFDWRDRPIYVALRGGGEKNVDELWTACER